MEDPETRFMREAMANPMIQGMVQQMTSNPETLRAMMRMKPQMAQLMDSRPDIARMMEDPETVQQALRMYTNPSLAREMTRSQDLAMGSLNTSAGGHNALLQAHQDFLDPLHQAMSSSGGAASQQNLNTYDGQQSDRNFAPLANPWGASPAPAAPAPSAGATTSPAPATPSMPMGQNPMAAMMGMGGGAQNPMAAMMGMGGGASPFGGANPTGNPLLDNLNQQFMSNPEQMQNMMRLTEQLMASGGGAGGQLAPPIAGGSNPTPAPAMPPAANPFAANPMAAMMQQMMGNPAQMQQGAGTTNPAG